MLDRTASRETDGTFGRLVTCGCDGSSLTAAGAMGKGKVGGAQGRSIGCEALGARNAGGGGGGRRSGASLAAASRCRRSKALLNGLTAAASTLRDSSS
eukprot:scaffold38353_cov31-Tisochrysis_lutea.AAC.4